MNLKIVSKKGNFNMDYLDLKELEKIEYGEYPQEYKEREDD